MSLKSFVNPNGRSIPYDDAPVEVRELDDLIGYLNNKHPEIIKNYFSQLETDKVRKGELEILMNYLEDKNNNILTEYLKECKPIVYFLYICRSCPDETLIYFKERNIGLIKCDELEEAVYMFHKQQLHDTSKPEIRFLLEKILEKPIEGYNSSIIQIGDKEYYMGVSFNEKGKQNFQQLKATRYVQDNILPLLQQYESRIQQLEAKLNPL
jgi:hypothetical protein